MGLATIYAQIRTIAASLRSLRATGLASRLQPSLEELAKHGAVPQHVAVSVELLDGLRALPALHLMEKPAPAPVIQI